MNLHKLLLVAVLVCSVLLPDSNGQSPSRSSARRRSSQRGEQVPSRKIEFTQKYTITSSNNTRSLRVNINLPVTLPDRQKVVSIKYSMTPTSVLDYKGNQYARFEFAKPDKEIEIEIKVVLELYRYDLRTAQGKSTKNLQDGEDFYDYLKTERYIEKNNPEIRKIAESLKGRSELETVKNIYDYVIENMEYEINPSRGLGAVAALEEGKGDCTEFSDIFVTLCRASNIPSKFCVGHIVQIDDSPSEHNWAEAYLKDYGWVPFDPTSGFAVKDTGMKDRAFSRLGLAYIYLSYLRHDSILQKSQFMSYRYRGGRVQVNSSFEFKRIQQNN